MKRIRIMWAKEKLNTLKDVYCRVRLAGKSGKLIDGTTWSLTVPTPEDFGFNCKEPHRYLQLNFSNPVARGTILMARYSAFFRNYQHKYASAVPSARVMVAGDFSQVIQGTWSAVEVLVNPYMESAYKKGNVALRIVLTMDVAIRHPEAFATFEVA